MEKMMTSHKTFIPTLALLGVLATTSALWSGAAHAQDKLQTQTQTQTQIYGSQLMTDAERTEYHSKIRTLTTDKERDAFRSDHHDNMKMRAAEKGVTLPNAPLGLGPKGSAGLDGGSSSGRGPGQGGSMNAPSGGGRGGR
jgi:hypothetical protein